MPTYEYECRNGHVADIMHPAGERPKVTCQVCGEPMKWCFSMPHIQTSTTFIKQTAKEQRRGMGFYSHQLQKVVYSKDDIKRELLQRGWGSEDFGIEPREPEKGPLDEPYQVSPKIVERRIEDQEEERGKKFAPRKRKALQEQLTAELSGRP